MCRSCEDTLDADMGGVDAYSWGVPMTMERGMGSMASLEGTLRKGVPTSWRQPELPEVIAMLNYRLDPVKTNAAAFLQHLTFKNDKVRIKQVNAVFIYFSMLNNPRCAATCVQVKSEVRRLKGIPSLVSMLDHPNKEVHHSACGALKNISYGRDQDNKIAIKNCDGVPALVRLLRKTHNQDLTDTITGIKIETQLSKVVFIARKSEPVWMIISGIFPRNLVEPFIPRLCKDGDRGPRLTRCSR